MIVLDEDERRLVACFLQDGFGEELIHFAVRLPVARLEDGAREGNMAQGPDAPIGQAVVVALLLLRSEPDTAQRVPRVGRRNLDAIVRIGDLAVGVAAAVGHPDTAASLHDGIERGSHTAGGPDALDFPVRAPVYVGLAI